MADVLRFWMGRGVDGFRVDASAVLAEDELLRDDPPNPDASEKTPPPQRLKRIFTDDRRESMSYLEEIRKTIDEFPDRMLAGEVQGKTDRIGHFYGEQQPRLHLPLNFALLDTPWDALSLQASILAMLLLTLRGTPFFFAGDELGMEQVEIPPNPSSGPIREARRRLRA